MSTLPTTTFPTLPRKAPLQRGTLENAKKSKPFRIFDFLWRRGPLIVGICLPVAIVLILLITPFVKRSYRVEGSLLIKPTKEPLINGGTRDVIQGDVGYFQRTLVLRLSDVEVLQAAISSIPQKQRPKFITEAADLEHATFRLMSRLKTKEVDRTYLIQVSLEDTDPNGLAETLAAVLDALVEKLHVEQENQYAARLSYLRSEKEKITKRADEEKNQILILADTVKNKAFLHESYTAHLTKVEVIQRLYWEAVAASADKAALFDKAVADQRDLEKFSLAPFAQERVADNFGINQIEQWTYGKSQELRSNIDGLTPGNPDRKYVEARMTSMNEYLSNYKKTVGDATIQNLSEKRKFELDTEVTKTLNGKQAAEAQVEKIRYDMEQAETEASKVSEAIFQARDFSYGINQLRERLSSINSRIDDAELEAKSPLPVAVDEVPMRPGQPATTNASKLRMMILMATFGMVGGVCLAFDFLDGRIRCREELAAAIGGPGAEPIPIIPGVENDFQLGAFFASETEHPASLAVRDLALRLALEHERSGARIMSFTGLHRQAGTTSIALGISRALATHGLKVLHIEMPTPNPGLATAAGLLTPSATKPAATTSRRSKSAPRSSIALAAALATAAGGDSPWGELREDPLGSSVCFFPWDTALDGSQIRAILGTFLEQASQCRDVIVLDLPPLEASDLAHEAALKSDVVVAVGRQDVATFAATRQTVEWLAAGSVPGVTLLLNFASADTFREHAFGWFKIGQQKATKLHHLFGEQVQKRSDVLRAKIAAKIAEKWSQKK